MVVVTGHEADRVAPLVERLGAVRAHNPAFESGMFSSVRAGVAALPSETGAFFVLPVDCPLVTPRALRLLLDRFAAGDAGLIYPTCLGKRGHPPLLSGRFIEPLLAAAPESNLQAFLASHAREAAETDVRDLTVLMDMDTPADYRTLAVLASALDAAGSSHPEPSLTADDALFLLRTAGTPSNVVRHCRTAAAVGVAVAEALAPRMPSLDVDLVRAGCLLHDIARLLPHHATLAAGLLADLGLPRLGTVVGEHMVIDPRLPAAPGITEAELVYLADKTVTEGEIVGLDERLARTIRKMRPSPETARRIAERIADGRMIAAKISAVLGHPVEEIIGGVELPPEAQVRTMRIYLARHARPEGPEDRRYRGQADPPLGAAGREQAHELGGTLMSLTGGACFDAVFASDLTRCRQTAEIAAGADGCTAPVQTEPWLREIDVGPLGRPLVGGSPGALPGRTRRSGDEHHRCSVPRRRELHGPARPGDTCLRAFTGKESDGRLPADTRGGAQGGEPGDPGASPGTRPGRYLLHRAGLLRGDAYRGRPGPVYSTNAPAISKKSTLM